MVLILRNGGSQSPDRWLREPRNNHIGKETSKYSSPQTYRNVLPAKFWQYTISASVIPCRIAFFLSTFVATYTSHAKESVALNHTLVRITFVKEFSAGCQPRYPVKTSNEMEVYPAPSAAQLLTMLLHREHFCSYLIILTSSKKSTRLS